MSKIYQCPHCGKDKRNVDEIAEDVQGVLDEADVNEIEGIDSGTIIDAIRASLELEENKRHPSKYKKLKKIKEIIENLHEELNEDDIIELQKELRNEAQELVKMLSNDLSFFKFQKDFDEANKDEMK